MGWSIGYDSELRRDIGYGVPAYCDHPDCSEEIDRGLSYVCGGEAYGGDNGCGMHFCPKHLTYHEFSDGEMPQVCEYCAGWDGDDAATWLSFPVKPDHPTWIRHKLTDPSWAEWRAENPNDVERMTVALEGVA